MPGEGCRGGHCGTDEMRAPARTLAALEIAVRRRRAALARQEAVVVHREAHRATRLAPFEAGVTKRAIESLGFRLRFHEARSRDHHRKTHAARHVAAAH